MLGVSPLWSRAVLRSAPPSGWGLMPALLVATHDASVIAGADRVFRLDPGCVVA